jgi:GNAT superfamily N-acetyltransferase
MGIGLIKILSFALRKDGDNPLWAEGKSAMSEMKFTIDVMSPKDLAGVCALAGQLGYPNSIKDIESRFAELHSEFTSESREARGARHALFVARDRDGRVVGWIHIGAEPVSLLVGPRCEIAALVVEEGSRSLGIGKALVARAEKWARENHFPLIRVRSNLRRTDAHRFYQREGYALAKTSNVFTKPLEVRASSASVNANIEGN